MTTEVGEEIRQQKQGVGVMWPQVREASSHEELGEARNKVSHAASRAINLADALISAP